MGLRRSAAAWGCAGAQRAAAQWWEAAQGRIMGPRMVGGGVWPCGGGGGLVGGGVWPGGGGGGVAWWGDAGATASRSVPCDTGSRQLCFVM